MPDVIIRARPLQRIRREVRRVRVQRMRPRVTRQHLQAVRQLAVELHLQRVVIRARRPRRQVQPLAVRKRRVPQRLRMVKPLERAHECERAVFAVDAGARGVYGAVQCAGVRDGSVENVTVDVGGRLLRNVTLRVGSEQQTVQVDGSGETLNTTDATVSTVINRQFVENLPLNGRSFQALITLAPGTEVVPSSGVGSSGEISVNGQRTEANYYTIDGVSANTGATVNTVSGTPGAGFRGRRRRRARWVRRRAWRPLMRWSSSGRRLRRMRRSMGGRRAGSSTSLRGRERTGGTAKRSITCATMRWMRVIRSTRRSCRSGRTTSAERWAGISASRGFITGGTGRFSSFRMRDCGWRTLWRRSCTRYRAIPPVSSVTLATRSTLISPSHAPCPHHPSLPPPVNPVYPSSPLITPSPPLVHPWRPLHPLSSRSAAEGSAFPRRDSQFREGHGLSRAITLIATPRH